MWGIFLTAILSAFRPLPRVLFLTSSVEGKGVLPRGAHLALEEFSRHGAFVTFHDISILYDAHELSDYDIMILPTAYGYHDVDRPLSLTFLDTLAMKNILEWVKEGGFLIAGGNIGRNTLEGKDRLLSGDILDQKEWPLGRAFGFDMVEISLKGFSLLRRDVDPPLFEWYPDTIYGPVETEDWILVPTHEEGDVRHLAEWTDGRTSYGGIMLRKYGRGLALYLSSFLLLHPSFDGGWADVPEITHFYHRAFLHFLGLKKFSLGVNPWPAAARAVLCVTLDDGGEMEEYRKTLGALFKRIPGVTFFVTGKLKPEILNFLKKDERVELGNHSFSHPFFRDLSYTEGLREILMAREIIGEVEGFRFPFVNYTPEGIFALSRLRFSYESSIKVDHLNDFKGALFPYNLVIAPGGNLITTDLLEISPVEEDWAFYRRIYEENYPAADQAKDQAAFLSFLNTMWSIISEARGVMVQMGHPMYEGHTDAFLAPLLEFIDSVKTEKGVWPAKLGEIASWWRRIRSIRVYVEEKKKGIDFKLFNPSEALDRFTLWIDLQEPGLTPELKFEGSQGFYFKRKEGDRERLYILMNLRGGKSSVSVRFRGG